eukprot:g3502.t1
MLVDGSELYLLRDNETSKPTLAVALPGKIVSCTLRLEALDWSSPVLRDFLLDCAPKPVACPDARNLGAGFWMDDFGPKNPISTEKYHLYESSPAQILASVEHTDKLYLHTRNPVAEISKLGTVLDLIVVDGGATYAFPDASLSVRPDEISTVIGTTLTHQERGFEAIEFISRESLRALMIAAIPNISDSDLFSLKLAGCTRSHLSRMNQTKLLGQLEKKTRKPCKCCSRASKWRRENAAHLPFYHWLRDVLATEPSIIFRAASKASSLSVTISNGQLSLESGFISVVSHDICSIVEIDTGNIHMMRLETIRPDGEIHSKISVYNSFGTVSLEILIPGDKHLERWANILDGR